MGQEPAKLILSTIHNFNMTDEDTGKEQQCLEDYNDQKEHAEGENKKEET
jgi:hypothetical protein